MLQKYFQRDLQYSVEHQSRYERERSVVTRARKASEVLAVVCVTLVPKRASKATTATSSRTPSYVCERIAKKSCQHSLGGFTTTVKAQNKSL